MFELVGVIASVGPSAAALPICPKERIRPKSIFGRRIHSKLGGMHSKLGGMHSNLAEYIRGRIHSQKFHFRVFVFGVDGITTFWGKERIRPAEYTLFGSTGHLGQAGPCKILTPFP